MIEQSGTYEIEHNVDEVFDYINQPQNLSELSPTIEESNGIGKNQQGAHIIEAEYTVAGGIASGEAVLNPEKYVQNEVIRYSIDDDIKGYIQWEFENKNNKTILTYSAEYEITIPVPDLFVNTVGQKISQREIDAIIENLRANL